MSSCKKKTQNFSNLLSNFAKYFYANFTNFEHPKFETFKIKFSKIFYSSCKNVQETRKVGFLS